jgi:acyl carrier protein
MQTEEIGGQVRQFIEENFLFREEADLADDESLLDAGLVDSTGILELVAFLEGTFDLQVADAEIVPENLDSINAIVAYVTGKLAAEPTPVAAQVAA